MSLLYVLGPIVWGLFLGSTYGLLFITQQARVLFNMTGRHTVRLHTLLLFFCRVFLLAICLYYFLRSDLIQSILVVTSILLAFWMVIILKKA